MQVSDDDPQIKMTARIRCFRAIVLHLIASLKKELIPLYLKGKHAFRWWIHKALPDQNHHITIRQVTTATTTTNHNNHHTTTTPTSNIKYKYNKHNEFHTNLHTSKKQTKTHDTIMIPSCWCKQNWGRDLRMIRPMLRPLVLSPFGYLDEGFGLQRECKGMLWCWWWFYWSTGTTMSIWDVERFVDGLMLWLQSEFVKNVWGCVRVKQWE